MTITATDTHFIIVFAYNPELVELVKGLPERRYCAPKIKGLPYEKYWSVPLDYEDAVRAFAKAYRFEFKEPEKPKDPLPVPKADLAPYVLPDLDSPFGLRRIKLFRHQKDGIKWLCEKRKAVLADDMGLGKTIVALLAASAFDMPIIVVCPASLMQNWKNEAAAVGVRLAAVYSWAKFPEEIEGNYTLIGDEAHAIQAGTGSQRGKKFLKLSKYARVCYCLTGTPMKNGRPINLLPLLVATNHPLSKDVRHYHIRFCDAKKTPWCFWDTSGARNLDELHLKTKDTILRRMKKDCFVGDTEILTETGVFTIRELAKSGHAKLYVQTPNGMQWIDCPIKSFGFQDVYKLKFGDGNTLQTTLGHQWIIRKHNTTYIKKTSELKVGKSELILANLTLPKVNRTAFAHGFVYGDGHLVTQKNGRKYTKVPLYGHDNDLLKLLLKHGALGKQKRNTRDIHNQIRPSMPTVYINVVNNLPAHWKTLPKNPTKSYALGFVLGLMEADGWMSKTQCYIGQANKQVLSYVRKLAIWVGLRCGPIYLMRIWSPIDGSYKPFYNFPIQTFNLKKSHFLRKDRKAKLMIRGRRTATTVSKLDLSSKQRKEVFCAVVPQFHNFTLANGVITRNCLDLPPKTRVIREAEVSTQAKAAYQAKFKELQENYQDRLRKGLISTGGEELVLMNHLRHAASMAKVDFAISLAQEILEEQGAVVLFTAFRNSAQLICERLKGILLTGSTPPGERQGLVDRFQRDGGAFVATIGAGGVGITLTRASTVILVDRDWTPAMAAQAEDRLHRIGQHNNVLALWIQYDSTDVAMDAILERKEERIDLVLAGRRKTMRGTGSVNEIAKEVARAVLG